MISKISYDSSINSFVGFSAPLIEGIPTINHFQTDGFIELARWFDDYDKSTMINIHLIETLLTTKQSIHSRPFILAAYGTNNKFSAIDVVR